MSWGPLIDTALAATNLWMSIVPRKTPSRGALEACRIVSHRGEHDNRTVRENTMEAFQIARDAGAWGLETDIRWTKDLVPMVHHDANTVRVFDVDVQIADVEFNALRKAVPQVPTLAEFIDAFGADTHLMLELKAEHFPQLEKQKAILRDHLSGLEPRKDYHFLALDPELFETFAIEPRHCCLPVSTFNFKALSEIALERGYSGLSGHFLVLNDRMKDQHAAAGQIFGTGFPTSKNALYRELNRGIDLIFTNHAVKLLRAIEAAQSR